MVIDRPRSDIDVSLYANTVRVQWVDSNEFNGSTRTLPSGHSKFDPGESRQQFSRHPHCRNSNKTRPLFPSIRQFATDSLANGTIWVLSDFATVITALSNNPPVSVLELRRRP